MIRVELSKRSVARGAPIVVTLAHEALPRFSQVQLEILDTGVMNPTSKLGMGSAPKHSGSGEVSIEIDSRHLPEGIFEIGLIRFHTPIAGDALEKLDFQPERDFARALFEVTGANATERTAKELEGVVGKAERDVMAQFAKPIDLSSPADGVVLDFSALVFVHGVLIGIGTRFPGFEIVPSHGGIPPNDRLGAVNKFLAERTQLGAQFTYNDETIKSLSASNPVCVAHFPHIKAGVADNVRAYCVDKVDAVLLALSLIRDAGGAIFAIVVVDHKSGAMTNYTVSEPYVGNILTGDLSGESAETLHTYLKAIESNPVSAFLASLYKQARHEKQADYQYVRFWQLLEMLADGRNYPEVDLLDHDGNVIMDGPTPRKCKGSINTVYALLRDEGIGDSKGTWEQVNVWFAFRSAAAHHGTTSRWHELSREQVRKWAEVAFAVIQKTKHDQYLWNLKENTKLLVMRELVKAGQKVPR